MISEESTGCAVREDAELLHSWRQHREEEAFAALVQRHLGVVYGVALRRTARPAVAEDVTQTVFTLLARKAAALKPGPLAPWLHRAAMLESAKAMRTELRHQKKLRAYASESAEEREETETGGAGELLQRLDGAVDALPDRLREVLVLRFYEGLSFREISARLGESEAAVQRRGHRALGKLQQTLRRAGFAGGAAASLTTVSHAALCTFPALPAAAVAARALSSAATALPSAGILTYLKAMHPATLITASAAGTALLLAIPLTLQSRRMAEAERKLAELSSSSIVTAAPGRGPGARAAAGSSDPAAPASVAALPSTGGTPGNGAPADTVAAAEAQAKRIQEAKTYGEKRATEEEERVMARLKERFSLTPQQEKSIAAAREQSRSVRQEFFRKRHLREQYEPPFFDIEYGFHPDIPASALAALDESQRSDYQRLEDERRTNYIEGWTGSELSYLADPVELTAEQKDLVFAKLHEVWTDYAKQDFTQLRTQADIAARKDADHQVRAEYFATIFTPEQFTRWEKVSLDFNRELVKRFQPAVAAPASASAQAVQAQ